MRPREAILGASAISACGVALVVGVGMGLLGVPLSDPAYWSIGAAVFVGWFIWAGFRIRVEIGPGLIVVRNVWRRYEVSLRERVTLERAEFWWSFASILTGVAALALATSRQVVCEAEGAILA